MPRFASIAFPAVIGNAARAALFALLAICAVAPAAASQPLSVEEFYQRAKFGGPSLSPSGKFLALLTPVNDRRQVAVMDLEKRSISYLTNFSTSDAISASWQTDDRLIINFGDLQTGSGEPPRSAGIIAINRDGSGLRDLPRSFSRPRTFSIVRGIPGGNEIFVTARDRTVDQADLYRYNTVTGTKELLSFETPGNVQGWVLDMDGVPRAITTSNLDSDLAEWYVRKDAKSPWKLMEKAKLNALQSTPMTFSADGKILYVRSRKGTDRYAIYEYDVEADKMSEPVIKHPERDVSGGFLTSVVQRKVLGFNYVDDKPATVWFDPDYSRIQKGIDGALKDTVNSISRAREGDTWLVTSFSERHPGTVYLLDGKTFKLEKLLDYQPWIKPEEMATTEWVRYTARDGMSIPAMLTLPKGTPKGKRVPLIVEIHGGPYVPATAWGFDTDTQFFASRGYAVLQPQFRGTSGYGQKHFSAGFRQWGDDMQHDLADGVKWAVAQGIADPERVCFFGASYGGYAAKWGAIQNADLIKCAVSFVGVSSIDYLFDNAQTDVARLVDRSSQAILQIGDPKTERERFKRVSPLNHADKVKVPILLAYGVEDLRVPLVHGTDFRAALDRHGKQYEWVTYEGEGHGFAKTKNRVDFYTRVEKFLARYLK